MSDLPGPVVLYDGLCGFCDASVSWILRHDREGVFRFAPLQGETAAQVLARHAGKLPSGIDSVILVEGAGASERVLWRSGAVLRICALLPWPWRAFVVFRVVPAPLRDLLYRFVAAIRFRIWGRKEACRIPSPQERARFLP